MLQAWSPRKKHGVPGFISWPSITPATQPSQHAVQPPHCRAGTGASAITAPQHFLNFLPLPQGHGSLRPTGMIAVSTGGFQYTHSHAVELRSQQRKAPLVIVYLAVLCTLFQGMAQRGAKMLASLAALNLGATPFQVGLLAALFPVFPLLLAVYAGRISDRIGVRVPMVGGSVVMALGLCVPLAWPGMNGLFAAAILIGFGHIFFHVSAHNLIGSYGDGQARVRNFATFSLGGSLSAFFGPALTGFSIDGLGFTATYIVLAVVALVAPVILLAYPRMVPRRTAHSR